MFSNNCITLPLLYNCSSFDGSISQVQSKEKCLHKMYMQDNSKSTVILIKRSLYYSFVIIPLSRKDYPLNTKVAFIKTYIYMKLFVIQRFFYITCEFQAKLTEQSGVAVMLKVCI
jgi:hypothetical protein